MITVVQATEHHAQELSFTMRKIDRLELAMSTDKPVYQALSSYVKDGCLAALDEEGRVVALFGCKTYEENIMIASPWLLASDLVLKHKRALLKLPTPYIDQWGDNKVLINYVHRDNKIAQRWLIWLGFTLSELSEEELKAGVDPRFRKFYKFGSK